jgi:uncharacterized protein YjbI with pentapeptide repeats
MANAEHVEVVKRGRDAIAEWRVSNPDVRLDLTKSVLTAIDLRGANLAGANFEGANLAGPLFAGVRSERARLELEIHHSELTLALVSRFTVSMKTDLAELFRKHIDQKMLDIRLLANDILPLHDGRPANLREVNLRGATLANANLTGADLTGADLAGADLMGTDLTGVDFTGADFVDANLAGAVFRKTTLADVDLSATKRLDEVMHLGPSSIGIDTIFRSKGKIPESFLRGCGVPDGLITYLPSLVGAGIEFYSAFISYSHNDEEFAKRLHSRMQQEHLRVWFAPEDMPGGKKIHEEIEAQIRVHDKLLIVLSEHSMDSEWVTTEIANAREREKSEGSQVLFPVRLTSMDAITSWRCFDADIGKDSAKEIREYYIPDFSNWQDHDSFEREFAKLLKGLKQPRAIPKAGSADQKT